SDRSYILVVPRALRQRNVQISAEAGARTALMRVSPYERIEEGGIGMDRHREHVGSLVEDPLCAVAVMHVDIEDRDALMLQPKLRRRHRAVVEKTEAAGHVGKGMMARRP